MAKPARPTAERPPTNMAELNARYVRHAKVTGFGLDTTQHFPCPFCGAPGWAASRILAVQQTLETPHTCAECGRSAVFRSMPIPSGGSTITPYQTGGPDQPAWLQPPMRDGRTPGAGQAASQEAGQEVPDAGDA